MEGPKTKFVYRLKNNFAFRAIIFPYMNHIRVKEMKEYELSEDSKKIALLKDKYKGKRCFIIGNGPSLKAKDLDKLCNEYTFAANRIYEIFNQTDWRPSFYFSVDNSFIQSELERLNSFGMKRLFLATDKNFDISKISNAIRIFEYTKFKINKWNDISSHISEDVSKYFSVGYTVTFTEIQMAIYMGFKEIVLLGVDFNYSTIRDKNGKIKNHKGVVDYFSGKKYESTVLPYYSNLYAYQAAKDYSDKHLVRILNATRGGKLDVFERVDFDSIMMNKIAGGGYSNRSMIYSIGDQWRCAV